MNKNIFFHYTSVEGLNGIIENKCLHATHIDYLNDSSENQYLEKLVEKYLIQDDIANDVFSTLYNKSYEDVFDNFEKYIVSFSELSDALPMWNYYSKGNGYNIGLSLSKIIERTNDLEDVHASKIKIIYNEKEQLKIISKFFKKNQKTSEKYKKKSKEMDKCQEENNESQYQLLSYEQSELIFTFMDEYSMLKKTFKHPSYSNEREVRLIIEPSHQYDGIFHRTTQNGLIIPFVKISILHEDLFSIILHPLQNNVGLNGLKHYLKNKRIDLEENLSISKIPYREI